MDIGRRLNSCDSYPRRKFKNPAPISCSTGPMLSPTAISFELHAKTAEKIDLEMCTFRNFGGSVTLTLTLDRVEVTLVCICVEVYPHTKFQATGQPMSQTQASDASTSRLPRYEAKCVQRMYFQWGSVPLRSDIKGTELPPANILIPLERQSIALQQFLYNETLQQTSSPLLSKIFHSSDREKTRPVSQGHK